MNDSVLRLQELASVDVPPRSDAFCAVVPVGAMEAHGRHAPLGTDNYIATEIAERLAVRTGAILCPPVSYGCLRLVYDFAHPPGSLSLRPETLTALCVDIGSELARHGMDPVVFSNGHGPNGAPLAMAAFRIHEKTGAQAGVLDWWTAAHEDIVDIKGVGYGNHADEIETSILLATEAGQHLVDLERAVSNEPMFSDITDAERDVYLRKLTFTHTFDERWVGESGNMGDPRRATREKGERIIAATVKTGESLVAALRAQRDTGSGPR